MFGRDSEGNPQVIVPHGCCVILGSSQLWSRLWRRFALSCVPPHDIPIPVLGKGHGIPLCLTEALDMTLKKMQ